jgi:hypothetical protein
VVFAKPVDEDVAGDETAWPKGWRVLTK